MNELNLRKKIHSCWYGKAIGGTLGAPYEGVPGPLNLSFYDPVPTEALPNDDLDLQVVWLHHLRTGGRRSVTPTIMAEAWQRYVMFPFDEYAIARRNHAWGLSGPAQGATDNFFGECMGAAIRSEVWACIAPGDPARAAGFAWADAVVDHCGEGVWAEVFNAALQSAAFVESDRDRLLDLALSFLPEQSRLKEALRSTRAWWLERPDWLEVRQRVISHYATGNFTHVVCNLCFQLIGWFDGDRDFSRAICTAVNCGFDTDCTGATLGALLGILAPDAIPQRWRLPIGEKVVLSPQIVGIPTPRNLAELTNWTLDVRELLKSFHPTLREVASHAPASTAVPGREWRARSVPINESTLWDAATIPSLPMAAMPITLPGAWLRLQESDFGSTGHLIELSFCLQTEAELKLMVFYRPGASVWVDRKLVHTVDAAALARDVFAAPSFHRAGVTAVVLPKLSAGEHTLTLGLRRPVDHTAIDLVWGFADPATNLWSINAVPSTKGSSTYAIGTTSTHT